MLLRLAHGLDRRRQDLSGRGAAGRRLRRLPQGRTQAGDALFEPGRTQEPGRRKRDQELPDPQRTGQRPQPALCAQASSTGTWTRTPLDAPAFGSVSASGIDPDESDDYFLTVTDFLTPTSLYLGTVGRPEREQLKSLPAFFKTRGLGNQPARGHLEGRHEGPLFPGGPERPAAGRQQPDLALRLRRLRDPDAAGLQRLGRLGLAGARRRLCAGEHPRRRRVRPQVARGGPQGRIASAPTTISSPWPRT